MDLAIVSLIITQTLVYAISLTLTALDGMLSERNGVVSVGLEGIMVTGTFSSVVLNLVFADIFGAATPWIACLVEDVVRTVFSLLYAAAAIGLQADHTISGAVINLMALALGVSLVRVIYQKGQTDAITQSFGYFSFPELSKIPVIGELLFAKTSLPAFVAISIAILAWSVIYKARFGLRLRSVGEHPQVADTLGVNVYSMRYSGVLLSSFLGDMGETVSAQSVASRFGITTIAGQGLISTAAVIFGKWNLLEAISVTLSSGFAQNLSVAGENLPIVSEIPKVYLQAAPYVLTILAPAVLSGESLGPRANGRNRVRTE